VSADGRTALLPAGPTMLRLREVPDAADGGWIPDDLQKGFRHIGFTVSDIDARAAALRAQGVRFRMEPKNAYGGVRIAFFYDPDGVLLEFVQGQLSYDRVHDQVLVDAARAVPPPATPSFDHVAVTVDDLEATVKTYAETLTAGFRDVVFTGEVDDIVRRLEQADAGRLAAEGALLVDPDGFPLRVETAL
jgi:catechol 2,3-dioxygenase-like lactoylglutathione lyase family enzyme